MTGGKDGGLTNSAIGQAFIIGEAVSLAGALVKLDDNGKMVLCTKATDEPDGYLMTDTKDRVTGVAQANVYRGVGGLVEGHKITVPVVAGNTKIDIGDNVSPAAGGAVNKFTTSGWIVGKALEFVGAATGGFVTVRVSKRLVSA